MGQFSSNQPGSEVDQDVVPNVEVTFGATREPAPAAKCGAKSTRAPAAAGGGKPKLSKESLQSLDYVSDGFVFLTTGDKPYYRRKTGDQLTEKGFQMRCAKDYGYAVIATEGSDGSLTEKRRNLAEYWGDPAFDLASRQVADGIVFVPTKLTEAEDKDANPEWHNCWHDLKTTMEPPNLSATATDIEIFIKHLMYLADGDTRAVMFFLCWLAQLYQTPGIKMPTAILFYSKRTGTGKTFLHKLLAKIFGPRMVGSCSGSDLNKSFDDVTKNKRILFVNEMARSDKADNYERFKHKVSEEEVMFEGKGRAARAITNVTHYIVTTNHEDALPLEEDGRRVLVIRCLADPKEPSYYDALDAWVAGPGPALVAGFLATFEFPAAWNPHAPVPQTEATRAMQEANKGEHYALIEEVIASNKPPMNKRYYVPSELAGQLQELYKAVIRTPFTAQGVKKILTDKLGFEEIPQQRVVGRGIDFRPRVVARPEHRGAWVSATAEERGTMLDAVAPLLSVVQGGADHGRA